MIFLLQITQQPVPEDINFGALIVRMVVFLGLTILLIVFLMRKVLPLVVTGTQRNSATKTIRVLERVAIDQRKSLLVVEIQQKLYLLGSAEGQINVLMELDREKVLSAENVAVKPQLSFSDILKKTLSRDKPS
jgi:flagellar biosynthetic protein FliO